MQSFFVLIKKTVFSSFAKSLFWFILATAVLGYSGGRFVLVKAFNDRVNILPGKIEMDHDRGIRGWQNIFSVSSQDLSRNSTIESFNKENSAYIVWGEKANESNNIILPETENPERADSDGSVLGESSEHLNDEAGNQILDFKGSDEEQNEYEETVSDDIGHSDESSSEIESSQDLIPVPTPENNGEVGEAKSEEVSRLEKIFDFFGFSPARAQGIETEAGNFGNETASNPFSSAIMFSDFFIPLEYHENDISDISLRFSLAANSELSDADIIFEYGIEGKWNELGALRGFSKLSNRLNGDYFKFVFPDNISWSDFADLSIRVVFETEEIAENKNLEIYLDALWLEVEYESDVEFQENYGIEPEDNLSDTENQPNPFVRGVDFNLDLLSEKREFKSTEAPRFEFVFKKKQGILAGIGSGLKKLFYDEYADIEIRANLKNADDAETEFEIKYLSNGKFEISLKDKKRNLKPGRHSLEIFVKHEENLYSIEQDFYWGVLALNVNKSVLLPGDTAYLQMAVLDDFGNTLCNADLELTIIDPSGKTTIFSSENGFISKSGLCRGNNVVNVPDYFAYYPVSLIGDYKLSLTAETGNGMHRINDSFSVREIVPFEIERVGPTRIYPLADYEMKFNVKANIDFKGDFSEYLPSGFEIVKIKQNGAVVFDRKNGDNFPADSNESKNEQKISWPVDWRAGNEYSLVFIFDAPGISPEFYLLGPAFLHGEIGLLGGGDLIWEKYDFSEIRQWQIASDAIAIRSEYATIGETANPSGDFSVSAPATVADDDYLVIIIGKDDDPEITAVSTGWTRADSAGTATGNDIAVAIFYKKITDAVSETASYNFNTDSREEFSYWIGALSGIDPDTPEDVAFSGTWTNLQDDSTPAATGITTQTNGAFVLAALYTDTDIDITLPGNPWNSRTETCGGENCLGLVSRTMEIAGATGDAEFSDVNATADSYTGQFAFRPEPPPDVTVSATGTQTSIVNKNSNNNYIGGKFVFAENIATSSITNITITESGTVEANAHLSDIKLYYNLDETYPYDCESESYSETDLRYGATSSAFSAANGTATFSGSVEISTSSSMCVYVVLDVGNVAYPDETIEIEINDPSSDIALGDGRVGPITSIELPGTTEIFVPTVSVDANEQYKSDLFTEIGNTGWTNENQINLSAYTSLIAGASTTKFDYYFNLIDESGIYSTATTTPAGVCSSGTSYNDCSSKIWTASASTTAWYDVNWSYRKRITINSAQVATTTGNFVVLATTTDSRLADTSNGGRVAFSDGRDILLVDSDGVTKLDYEREHYDNTTGELVIWIETGISSTSNKTIYLYYGNASVASDQQNITGTWDSAYTLVNHLKDDPGPGGAGDIEDSTANANNATAAAGMTSDDLVSGMIGSAIDFDGVSDSLTVPSSASMDGATGVGQPRTWSYWINFTDFTANTLITDKSNFQKNGLWSGVRVNPNKISGGVSATNELVSDTTFSAGEWYHVVFDYDGAYSRLYVNGVLDAGPGAQTAPADNANNWLIMGRGNNNEVNGKLDELRVTNVSRDADWILTEYNNQKNVAGFLAFSEEESISSAVYEGIVNASSLPDRGSANDSSLGYKWKVFACTAENECSDWDEFNQIIPNFKVDTTPPTAPGNLSLATTTATTMTLIFGSESEEANFAYYRIFYKSGLSGVSVNDSAHSDSNLNFIDYNQATSTLISGLEPDTKYIVNIWAYDLAGNRTAAQEIAVTTAEAPHARARSVEFLAGVYSSPSGLSGQNSNTNQTFSAFNFSLSEKDVEIRSAYILFEAQFDSYNENAGNYTGYEAGFDACLEPCSAGAFSGSGTAFHDSDTVLAYDASGGNQIRLLFDVSDEEQLASYTGDGAEMEAQFGYNLQTTTATTSIANAKAILILTYAFNEDDSENITNTVKYPLESTEAGDSGSRLSVAADDCTKNSNCPTFEYYVAVPELSTSLSQWFSLEGINIGHGSSDVAINVNLQNYDVDSNTYYHEASNGGEQGHFPSLIFKDVYGYAENSTQVLEYYLSSPGAASYYILGGETIQTYTAAKSASVKTRTVSFPIGVLTNGQSTNSASGSATVYFPENGSGYGVVEIQKAWFRIISNNYSAAADTLTVSSKVGDNTVSGDYAYNLNAGENVIKPSFKIIHIIPDSDYAEMAKANSVAAKEVLINTANGSINIGGVSAELMITYTYTDESGGYLASLDIFGGQSGDDSNSQSDTENMSAVVFPEMRGTKTLRSGGILGSFLFTDSDGGMPSDWFTVDINISTGSPVCSPAGSYAIRSDGANAFAEYFKNVNTALTARDKQAYSVCYANENSSSLTAGAKMNAILRYTYQWNAPPPELTQNDWRWYANSDSINPGSPLAVENSAISNVNIGDILRLRLNVAVTKIDLATSTQSFALQFVDSNDCASAGNSWKNLGGFFADTAWRGYNNPDPANGETLASTLLLTSTVAQSYEEANNSASNPRAIPRGGYAEWDWVLYNNSATSSSNYCFRMVQSDGTALNDYVSDGYPVVVTAASNTAPSAPATLVQKKADNINLISNNSWINENSVILSAAVTDPNMSEQITIYFEIASSTGVFTTSTAVPTASCDSGTAFSSCPSRIWKATSALGDYRATAFTGTSSIIGLPDYNGYKWQALACDDSGACSAWTRYNLSFPNFKIDTTPPEIPGNLQFISATPISMSIALGATSSDDNFLRYRVFYKVGTSGVSEADREHADDNFLNLNFNGATSTLVLDLSADTEYVFNIWAYDQAGNKASATQELISQTAASFNPPTGFLMSSSRQKTEGSGIFDVTILVDDDDNNDTLRAKLMYNDTCDFSGPYNTASIDETDSSTFATYGDPKVDNSSPYQVGTTSGWILTSPGQNYVFFDWLSYLDLPEADGEYCLGLVVNDGMFDQVATHTRMVMLDNVKPTAPGALSLVSKNNNSVTLSFGTSSMDTNFSEYKIFYKEGISGVSSADNAWTKNNDINLGFVDYALATGTTISGLKPKTEYVFNIWAFDSYGNNASSVSELTVKTNTIPANIAAVNQYYDDAVTAIFNNSWINDNRVILKASAHDQDEFDFLTFYFQLISATGTYADISFPPGETCAYGDSYETCSSRIWAVSTSSSDLPSGWYDGDWLYRKEITINSAYVEASASGFPVLIKTVDSDLAAAARVDAYDVLFTDSSGTNPLQYEREYYNPVNGQIIAWVKADLSDLSDTVLYMYYGNPEINIDPATTTGVWDEYFRGVWHLSEDVVDESSEIGAHRDSSVYGNDGDQYGNNEKISGIFKGQDFDGFNDYIEIGDSAALDVSDAFSMSFWLNGEVGTPPSASSTEFSSAGSDTFVVPPGVTEIKVKSWGGGGGGAAGISGPNDQSQNNGGHGGGGGFAEAVIPVIPGETLSIMVGGGGGGGSVGASGGGGGGGGGGRTEIARASDPLLVAAGGGGGGGASNRTGSAGANGGAGGGLTGTGGSNSGTTVGGGGGTQSAGGAAGTGTNDGQAGGYLTGGAGADGRNAQGADGSGASGGAGGGGAGGLEDISARYPGGGGGGSGYYGGGGGGEQSSNGNAGAGGGGGSSYASSSLSQTAIEAGSGRNAGNNDDSDYDTGIGQGGTGGNPGVAGTSGGDGLVILEFTPAITLIGKGTDAYQFGLTTDSVLTAQINNQSLSASLGSGWHHVALTYDRNEAGSEQMKLFVNGELLDSAAYTTAINTNSSPIKIGEFFDGMVDELQISNTARSSGWIKTAYNNQSSPGSFASFSAETTVTSYYETNLIVEIPDNPRYASGYKWQVMACDDDGDCTGWDNFNDIVPNFKVDTTPPTAPGQLLENAKTSNSVTLDFGIASLEDNFTEYRIYYSKSLPVSESDFLHASTSDPSLAYINYNLNSNTTISNLDPATTYYFNIWAYDVVNHKASSTYTAVTTNDAVSTPGIMFYTKNDRAVYYREWTGSAWGSEKSSGDITGLNDNIRHIRSIRSDNGAKIGLLLKTWDGSNQNWYGAVYRYAADDFVNVSALGSAWNSTTNNDLMTACIAPLSGGEFFIVRNDNAGDGAIAFSWNGISGWTAEGTVPGTDTTGKFGVMNGCDLVRRPNTDNYLLVTFDDSQYVGSMYYYGGSSYDNGSGAWTAWTDHSSAEEDVNNFVGGAYFDSTNNTRGALYYSNSANNNYAYAKYFQCTGNSINYGGAQPSPAVAPANWGNDFVHGEFAPDPGGSGIAYFAGRDIGGELNVYRVNVSSPTISWSSPANGDNISSGNLYSDTNYAQMPFASKFYKNGKGIVVGNYSGSSAPFYSVITTSGNSLSATSSVEGATADIYSRVRLYTDPNEDELLAIFQNDNIDYSAVFWDPANDRFYNSGNQAWTEIAASTGAADENYENTAFAYAKYNSAPSQPSSLIQYKSDASTTIANMGWTDESTVKLEVKAFDVDTREAIRIYIQLVSANDSFATTSDYSVFNACSFSDSWTDCSSKIWLVASSTSGDYSIEPFTATATISSLNASTIGYKWQALACDDKDACSSWQAHNVVAPNFYVDTEPPSAPGNLTVGSKTSHSVTLSFGSPTNEPDVSFFEYKIFYKTGASGVLESDMPWTQVNDGNLASRIYGGALSTTITGLASSTQYVFNIWAYDKAGNKTAAALEVSTTTNALPFIRQKSFLIENDDGADVNSNSAEVAASTTLQNLNIGERFAVRIQIENYGGDIKANNNYKLQFENNTDTPGVWSDVTSTTSIAYSPGLSGTAGDLITSSKAEANTYAWRNGIWRENTAESGAFTLDASEYSELVFMAHTANATTSKTYRFRLYDKSGNESLADYEKYPSITTVSSDVKRYSKESLIALPTDESDLEYYFDPEGYADILSSDGNYDELSATNAYPVFLFASKNSNNSDAASGTWIGQTSTSTASKNVYLQIFRFGSINNWVTVATQNSAGANTDFALSGNVNSSLSDYYDSDNQVYWRVYQESGTEVLRSDYFNVDFTAPVPEIKQNHYRWRADDGTEETASWLENEDQGSPLSGSEIGIGSSTRLRFGLANLGGGTALDYNYRLEYASSSLGCDSDPGDWRTVPATASTGEHFEMFDSVYFDDASSTSARLANSEAYVFVAGDMVEYPSNSSANISLAEGRYTEIEYAFRVTDDADSAQTYCFRLTNNGSELEEYARYPLVTLAGSTNIAPSFSVHPGDYDDFGPSSTSSPTNEDSDITFKATAEDADGDTYYLAICKAPGISAGNDASPTCTNGAWCVSAETASGVEASCVYTAATSTEENEWYAYACDKVFGYGQAKCSAYSQGSGDPDYDSPFVINHRPIYASVATVEDNKDPGQDFRVTAYVVDDDVAGGADTMDFYVCDTDSADYASGCSGITLCSEIATTSPNASCVFSTSTPAIAGTYDYYAFVFDGHGLAASPAVRQGTYTVNNSAPVLGPLVLNEGEDIVLYIKGAGDTQVSTVNASISDLNGCRDIESAVGAIYMSGASGAYNCVADDNQCYQIDIDNCIISDCDDFSDMLATLTCTANIKYFAIPTDDVSSSNPWRDYFWLSYINVFDGVNYSATTSAPVELATNLAINVPETEIFFGSGLFAGDNTGIVNPTSTIENAGNSPINSNIKGTDLSGIGYFETIGVTWIKWGTSTFEYELEMKYLKATNQLVNTNTPRPVAEDTVISDRLYWGIGIPFNTYPDLYRGQNTFTAIIDEDDW